MATHQLRKIIVRAGGKSRTAGAPTVLVTTTTPMPSLTVFTRYSNQQGGTEWPSVAELYVCATVDEVCCYFHPIGYRRDVALLEKILYWTTLFGGSNGLKLSRESKPAVYKS
jgi:hypothetical protein